MVDAKLMSCSNANATKTVCDHGELSDAEFARRSHWTESLVVATNAVDSADKALLPGTFRTLEMDFGMDPKSLSSLILFENILQVSDDHVLPRIPLVLATQSSQPSSS